MQEGIINKINTEEDDGTLKFLEIPRNKESRHLNGDIIKQSAIVNRTFWVFDYLEDVPTKYSKDKGKPGQTLVQIRFNKEDLESECKKFFSGSESVLYVLREIRKLNAFPRKVTLRSDGLNYYFE